MMVASSLQYCGVQATLAQEQLYMAEHCLDEKFTIEEVLLVSTGYQGVFPVPSFNTTYLSAFLDSRHVDRLSLDD